jgi:nucleotide-binding universal stress UspA family protein
MTWEPAGPGLVEAAQEAHAELIVVPMRRGSALGHALHDIADRHVLHHGGVPVLVVPT